jgi:adenylosuccinate lyase
MRDLWSERSQYKYWLAVELAVVQALVELGLAPEKTRKTIAKAARINVRRISEIEATTGHDLIAFVEQITESLEAGGAKSFARYFHSKGLTSYSIEDPATMIRLGKAVKLIIAELERLEQVLVAKAFEHQWTLMIGRTHGQFAEPTTFGQLLLAFAEAIHRSVDRLKHDLETELSVGAIAGALGNFAGMNPEVSTAALTKLGLKPDLAPTQIIARDRHAAVIAHIGIAAGSIQWIAQTLLVSSRSEIREALEGFRKGQKGSSAMPHKRNPILTENSVGLARQIRSMVAPAIENAATDEWRRIEQSSVERHILPDATSLLHFLTIRMRGVIERLEINPQRMKWHLEVATYGVWAAQQVREAMRAHGLSYDTAYKFVQQAAFQAFDSKVPMQRVLQTKKWKGRGKNRGKTAEQIIGTAALAKCFDARAYVTPGIQHLFDYYCKIRNKPKSSAP